MIVEFILTVVLLVALSLLKAQKPKNFPPGPFSLPIVGNLLQLGLEPYKTLLKMRDTYGDVIGIQLGSKRAVFINNAKLVKEAFNLNTIMGRPFVKFMMNPENGKKRGVIFTDGAEGAEQRRFISKALREFGFGKKTMEALIQEEVVELVDGLQKSKGQPIDTHVRFNVAVINALWTIVSGEKFSHSDSKVQELIGLLAANMSSTKVMAVSLPFPYLCDWAPGLSGYTAYVENLKQILNFIQQSIDSHKISYDREKSRDLIDCYIKEKTQAPKSSSFYGKSGDENMLFGVFDLFWAGGETASTTLSWLCFLLAHHPKCQEKLGRSIQQSIGCRTPCLADRPNMPFLEAVYLEVLRFSALAPLGAMHETTEDITFHGYDIPKGTMVFANQFGILHDPKVWGDPQNFRPERFLSDDEQTVLRHEAFVPFSVGKRGCLGETLARDELFLFSAGIIQKYKVDFDPSSPVPPIKHSVNTPTLSPPPHKIIFSDRIVEEL